MTRAYSSSTNHDHSTGKARLLARKAANSRDPEKSDGGRMSLETILPFAMVAEPGRLYLISERTAMAIRSEYLARELKMPTILDEIVARKWLDIDAARTTTAETELEKRAFEMPPVRDFTGSLQRPGIRIIAEVKKASPSAGIIRADFDPAAIARIYEAHGADCLSVLTDTTFFQGELRHLIAARAAVAIPVLRKEFILDRYQLLEARAAGADAVLLIAEILPGNKLKQLFAQAVELGLHVLVELHDADQLQRVVDCGATLIGINNRDLRTFKTSLEHTLALMPLAPSGRCVVSESGIKSHADLQRLEANGVKAILVGESLMRAQDIGAALDQLRGVA